MAYMRLYNAELRQQIWN